MVQLPNKIIDEAKLLHDCLKERGHLNINDLLSFLNKIITSGSRNKLPKRITSRQRYEFFMQHLENSKKGKYKKQKKA